MNTRDPWRCPSCGQASIRGLENMDAIRAGGEQSEHEIECPRCLDRSPRKDWVRADPATA